jgi:hypothetical protein
MKSLSEARARALIDAHFARRISPARERDMRAHLAGCDSCGKYYESHLLLETITARSAQARERLANGLGLSIAPQRGSATWVFAATLATAASAVVLARAVGVRHDAEFAARGGAREDEAPRVHVYKLNPTRELAPNEQMKRSDELAFAYTNPRGFHNLLVFGVDEHRHVYWYQPAWTKHIEHPRAIAIESGPVARELPEAVRHDLDGQTLTVYAVFLDENIPVERVEELVGGAAASGDALVLPGAYQQRIALAVERD